MTRGHQAHHTGSGSQSGPWRGLRLLGLLGTLVAALAPCFPAQPGRSTSREYAIKASYLRHFLNYMTWPRGMGTQKDTYVIAVVDSPALHQKLVLVTRKYPRVRGRAISVRTCASPDKARPCHILFVGGSQQKKLDAWRRVAEREHALLVGDTPGFEKHGAAVNFQVKGNKVRLQINLEAARRADIKISSKLLKLATIIKKLDVKDPAPTPRKKPPSEPGKKQAPGPEKKPLPGSGKKPPPDPGKSGSSGIPREE